MFRQRFDRVVNFGLSAHLIEQQRFVGLQLAPENSLRDAVAGSAQTLGQRAHLVVEAGAGKDDAMLACGVDQVEPDLVKIQFDFVRGGLFADFIAKHSDVAAEWSRADRVLGFAAPESKNFWRVADRESQHANPDFLRHRKMSCLVHDHQHGEDQCCVQNRRYHLVYSQV